jgi:hypothetical protein
MRGWAVVALVAASAGGCDQVKSAMNAANGASSGPAAAPPPPPGPVFVPIEVTPPDIIAGIVPIRRDEARQAAMDRYKDIWIAEPGWTGGVEKLHEEGGKTFLWMLQPASTIVGWSFWVVAVLPVNDRGVRQGDHVTFVGRLDGVQLFSAGPIEGYRIPVRDAWVLTVNGK